MRKEHFKILIADHDPQTAQKLFDTLSHAGYSPIRISDSSTNLPKATENALREQAYDLVFVDATIGSDNGGYLAFGNKLHRHSPKTKIIFMLDGISQRPAKDSMPATGFRFLLKPIEYECNIVRLVNTCLQRMPPHSSLLVAKNFSEYIAASPNLKDILQKLVNDVVAKLRYEICAVILRREDDPLMLYIAAARGISLEHQSAFRLGVGEGVTGGVIAAGQPQVVPNIFDEPDYRYPEFAIKENLCSMISIPIRHNHSVLGALNVYTGAGYFHVFTRHEINLLSTLANWTAFAIQNAEKYETREKEQRRLIEEIIRETQSFDTLEKMIKSVLEKSTALVAGNCGCIAFVDFERMRFNPVYGYRRRIKNIKKLKIGTKYEGIAGRIVRSGEAEIVPNVYQDSRYIRSDRRIKSKVIVPLKYQNQVVGVLSVDSAKEAFFKEDDKRILSVLASHLALIFQKQKFDQAFKNLGNLFRTSHDLAEIYDAAVRCAAEFIGAHAVALWEKGVDNCFVMRASHGFEKFKEQNLKIRSTEGIISQVIKTQDVVVVEDVAQNERYVHPEMIAGANFKWLLCVPMFFANEVFGVIDIYSRRPHGFFDQEVDYLKALASQAGVAIQNAKLIDHFNRIGQTITSTQNIKTILENVAKSALEVLCAEPVILFQYDQVSNRLVSPPYYAGRLMEEKDYVETFEFSGHSFAELIIAGGESVYIEKDIDQYPLMIEAKKHVVNGMPKRRFNERERTESLAALILRVENEIVGLMFLNYRTPQTFTPIEKKIMETFAAHAAIAIKNSRLIEQMRRNNEQMRHHKEYMQAIIEGTPDPIIVTENKIEAGGPVWMIELANRAAHEMFGYDFNARELEGENARARFGEQLDRVRQALREANGEIADFETVFFHKNGYPLPISLSTSVMQRDAANPLRVVKTISIAKDLSSRKALEKQLDHLNRATISLLNAATLDQAYDAIFENLRQIGYDKALIALVDEAAHTIVAKRAVGENWKKMAKGMKIDLKSNHILAVVVKTGEPQLVEDGAADLRSDPAPFQPARLKSHYVTPLIVHDKVIGALQIDLSNKQDLLKGDKYFLQENLRILSGFANQIAVAIEANRSKITIDKLQLKLADVGHEFRSPLHIIIAQLGGLKYHLKKSYAEDQYVTKTAKIVEEEAFRAARQMKNTLLSTVESLEALGINFEKGFIGDTIKLCADRFFETADKRGIRIILRDNVKKLPAIYYDKTQMEQVFTNLIDNAVKYSHFNQNIEITGRETGRYVEISIMDRGLGIPKNQYERIFQGFNRSEILDTTRYIPGTGLGLMIAKEIVERHRGKIKVESVPFMKDPRRIKNYDGYETTFSVLLPQNPKEV
ncbi:MAG: GAF domain-containing protein [bacterium]